MVVQKHIFACRREQKVLFSRIVKPRMFGLGIAPKEVFLAYSTQFLFLSKRLVPGSVVSVAIDMHRESPIITEWLYGLRENVYFNIFVLFIVGTTSIFVSYCLLFLSWWELVVVNIVAILFIHLFTLFVCFCLLFLFIYLFAYFFCYVNHFSYLCCCCCHHYCCFCCWCLVIVVANIMLMFSILV